MSEPPCFPTAEIDQKQFSDTRMVLNSIQNKTFYIGNEMNDAGMLNSLTISIPGHDYRKWKMWKNVYEHLCDEIRTHKCFTELYDAYVKNPYDSTKVYPNFYFQLTIATFEQLKQATDDTPDTKVLDELGRQKDELRYLNPFVNNINDNIIQKLSEINQKKIKEKKIYTFESRGHVYINPETDIFKELIGKIISLRMFLYREDAGLKPYKENTSDEKIHEIYSGLCERFAGSSNISNISNLSVREQQLETQKEEFQTKLKELYELYKEIENMKKDSENREVITYNTGVINRDEPRNEYEESKTVIKYKKIVTDKEIELGELLRHTQGLEGKPLFTKWMYDKDKGYHEYVESIPAEHKECYEKLKEMERKNIKKTGGKRSRKSKKRSRKSKKRTRKNKKSKRKSN